MKKTWIEELKQHSDANLVLMLVGNKIDLNNLRQVEKNEVQEFADENGYQLIETSALEGVAVDDAFRGILTEIYKRMVERQLDGTDISSTAPKIDLAAGANNKQQQKKKGGGCC